MPTERHPPVSDPYLASQSSSRQPPAGPYRPVNTLYGQGAPVSRNNPSAPVSRNNPAPVSRDNPAPISRNNPAPVPRYGPSSQSRDTTPRYGPTSQSRDYDPTGYELPSRPVPNAVPEYAGYGRVGAPPTSRTVPQSQSQYPSTSSSSGGIGGLQANNWRLHSRDLLELRPVGQLRSKAPVSSSTQGSFSNPLDLTGETATVASLYTGGTPYASQFANLNGGKATPVHRGSGASSASRKTVSSYPEYGVGAPISEKDATEGIKNLLEGMNEVKLKRRKRKGEPPKVDDLADIFKNTKLDTETPEPEEEEFEELDDEEADKVDGLDVTLLPHQIDGLAWLLSREEKKARGGILADDMGLGKTVQSIALILSHPHPKYPLTEGAQIDSHLKLPSDLARTTLIVGPLALIKQWEAELLSKTTSLPRKIKVYVHHGSSRTKDSRLLSKYDVVITTYPIVASEHKSTTEDNPSALFGVRWWRIILDEAHSIKNPSAKGSQACFALRGRFRWCLTGTPLQNNLEELQSLIRFLRIAPYDEMPVWKDQIVRPLKAGKEELAMSRLKVILGAILLRRTKKVLGEKEKKRIEAGEEKGRNEMMNLPARNVKNVVCKFSPNEQAFYERLEDKTGRALDKLQGANKMNYTGALVLLLRLRQACNHPQLLKGKVSKDLEALAAAKSTKSRSKDADVDELADILDSLAVETKQCDICLETLTKEQVRASETHCDDCRTNLIDYGKKERKSKDSHRRHRKDKRKDEKRRDKHTSKPKKQPKPIVIEDSTPEEDSDSEAIPSKYKNLTRLKQKKPVKVQDDSDDEGIPSRYRQQEDSDEEGIPSRYRQKNESDEEALPKSHRKKEPIVISDSDETEDGEGAGIDSFIVDDDGYEEIYKQRTKRRPRDERIDDEAEESSGEESPAFDQGSDISGSEAEESENDSDGNPIPKRRSHSDDEDDEDDDYASSDSLTSSLPPSLNPSTKITQLLKILQHELSQQNKTIIFSQFTSMLDLIEPFLTSLSLPYTRYDGSMPPALRESSLHALKTSRTTNILLCSLKCGAVGLNLTAACRVVLLEPFWNPAIEDQAIDRVHRFGQKKDVIVYKFSVEGSVEERVLELQEGKRKLIEAAIGDGGVGGVGKLGMREIMALFGREAENGAGARGGVVGGTYHMDGGGRQGVNKRYDAGVGQSGGGRYYGRYS